jgi:hypothetical protein
MVAGVPPVPFCGCSYREIRFKRIVTCRRCTKSFFQILGRRLFRNLLMRITPQKIDSLSRLIDYIEQAS